MTALMAMRGIDMVAAIAFLAEIGDLSRFENPAPVDGLSWPGAQSERSTGESVKRGGITKAGNRRARRMLVEAAWSYRYPAARRQGQADQDRGRATDGPRDRLEGADAGSVAASGH